MICGECKYNKRDCTNKIHHFFYGGSIIRVSKEAGTVERWQNEDLKQYRNPQLQNLQETQ